MLVVVYALAIATGIAIALAIYLTILALMLGPLPDNSQGTLQVPADGARCVGAPSDEAARAPHFAVDPLDDNMVLPAAWPSDTVVDMHGRPYFVRRA